MSAAWLLATVWKPDDLYWSCYRVRMPDGAALRLQPGPQRQAAESEARVIVYGGAKGGGKSFWLLFDPLQECLSRAAYTCTVFRRTYPELRGDGALWDESVKLYGKLGADSTPSSMLHRFPSGARVSMRHMQHDSVADSYNGKNLGDVSFDEGTFFTAHMFWTLLACMRASGETPPKFRITCNPDPDSWLLEFVEWYLDKDGFADPKKSGVVRWFKRTAGRLEWFDHEVEDGISFTFISANVWDNAALVDARPEYISQLRALPPVAQARMLGGNWKVREASGDYFQPHWFRKIGLWGDQLGFKLVRTWRSWDFAATPVEGCLVPDVSKEVRASSELRKDADWTRGVKFGQLANGQILVLDVKSARDTPGAVEELVKRTARADGRKCTQVIWQDPAQAGVHQLAIYSRLLRGIAPFMTCLTMNPLDVARIASREVFAGRVSILDGLWNDTFLGELQAFPSEDKRVHDDQVSAFGLGIAYSLEHPIPLTSGLQSVNALPPMAEAAAGRPVEELVEAAYQKPRNDMRGRDGGARKSRFILR